MKRSRGILARLLIAASVFALTFASSIPGQEEHAAFWHVVQTVNNILAGKEIDQAMNTITKGASLVYGARFENLKSVVTGEVKTCTLADTSYRGVMIQAETNTAEDMGFLVLKTVASQNPRVRYHTVIFKKDSTGQFKIHHWQAGD